MHLGFQNSQFVQQKRFSIMTCYFKIVNFEFLKQRNFEYKF